MRALVPMTLAAVIGVTGATRATPADELVRIVLDQIDSAHQQNCDALERAPVRHWGQLSQLRPWTDLRHELVSPGRSAESRARFAGTADERFNAIYANFVEQLQLAPAGNLVVGVEDRISAVPQTVECTAFVDVPTALVLRVKPGGSTEPIVIASGKEAGVEIEGQTLTPAGSLTLYAVLPLTASGTPGRRELGLHVSAAGHHARIPLVIDVRQSGQLAGTIREADSNERTSLVAKLFVEDATGRLYVAPGAPSYTTQNWYGTWLPRFKYVNSSRNSPSAPHWGSWMSGPSWKTACRTSLAIPATDGPATDGPTTTSTPTRTF